MEYSYTQLRTEFNIRNRNTDNFVYNPDEVNSALKSAINYDPLVFRIGSDSSLTTAANTYSYTPSENFEAVTDIKYDYFGNGSEVEFPYRWRFEDGLIKMGFDGQTILAGKLLIIKGKIKLTDSDLIPSYLVDYVLHNAAANAITQLMSDKSGRFLRNDTTMGELQTAFQTHKQAAQQIRPMLMNRSYVRF